MKRENYFEQAKQLAIVNGYCSMDLIMNHFNIGRNMAGMIVDDLENAKVIRAFNGSKKRELLIAKTPTNNSQPELKGEEKKLLTKVYYDNVSYLTKGSRILMDFPIMSETQFYKAMESYATQRLAALQKENEDKWISVEDRLPDDDREVLVYLAGGVMALANYSPTFGMWEGFMKDAVTHWTLPQPPTK